MIDNFMYGRITGLTSHVYPDGTVKMTRCTKEECYTWILPEKVAPREPRKSLLWNIEDERAERAAKKSRSQRAIEETFGTSDLI